MWNVTARLRSESRYSSYYAEQGVILKPQQKAPVSAICERPLRIMSKILSLMSSYLVLKGIKIIEYNSDICSEPALDFPPLSCRVISLCSTFYLIVMVLYEECFCLQDWMWSVRRVRGFSEMVWPSPSQRSWQTRQSVAGSSRFMWVFIAFYYGTWKTSIF